MKNLLTFDEFVGEKCESKGKNSINEFGPGAGSGNVRADDLDNKRKDAAKKSEKSVMIYVVGGKHGTYKLSKYYEKGNTYAAYYNGMPQIVEEGLVNESEKIHESKGYEGDVDTAEDIIDLIYELPNSIQSLRLPFDIKGKSMLDLTPSKDKDWKEKAAAVIKDIVGKEGNRLKFKLKSHFGRGGDNEPYYLIIIK